MFWLLLLAVPAIMVWMAVMALYTVAWMLLEFGVLVWQYFRRD